MSAVPVRVAIVFSCLCVATATAGQAPPEVNNAQRALLQAVIQAVDAAAQPPLSDADWPAHIMRASDGSHYVAFSVVPPSGMSLPAGPALLYVRLATAPAGGATTVAERSAIRDWLAGRRVDPRLLPGRGIVVGEMPQMGATANLARRNPGDSGLNDLQHLGLQRQRARERQAEADKQRRAELESQAVGLREMLPFEDFDLDDTSTASDGTRQISRALTAGPGSYDLLVGWADPSAATPASTIQVIRRTLHLPPATSSDLTISSVIVADDVQARATPYSPAQQSAHPYTIGPTEIVPARDATFTRDEQLAVAFQVINALPSSTGKPDVGVDFRIVRVDGGRELPVASLTPQSYSEASMPADFDLRLGHPLFVAMAVPLATVARGEYRLKIAVNDRLAGATRSAETAFTVAGTPLSLLAEAPSLGRPFRREDAIEGAMLGAIVHGLTPDAPSPALRTALELAAARKFVDLLAEEPVPQREQATRTALMGLALYAIGDASALTQFQRAYALGAPGGPVQWLTGAVRALQNRDPEAIAAWQSAIDEGLSAATPFLADAYLRRGDGARASALVAREAAGGSADPAWTRTLAATHLAMGRYQDALAALDARVAQAPDDADARWLQLQALYGRVVKDGNGDRERFRTTAQAYIAAGGANAALATEWLRVLSK
jgi:tetratricopeptide (TPR) repeat protein